MTHPPPDPSLLHPARSATWLRNIATSYGDVIVGGVIYILLTPILVRSLGVEAYAIWLVSHTITFYLGLFDLGFSQAHVRYHARYAAKGQRAALRRLAATVFLSLSCAGLLALGLASALVIAPLGSWFDVSGSLEADFRLVILILGLNLLLNLPGATLENVYEGEERFDIRNLRSMMLRVISAGLQLWLLWNGYGIVALALVELAVSILCICVDLVLARRLVPGLLRGRLRLDRRMLHRIRPFALWAFVDDLLVEGSSHLDKLVLALLLPLALLTPYALCIALAGLLILIVQPVTETFFPMAAGFHARGRQRDLARLLISGTKAALAPAVPLALLLWVFGEQVLLLWVPEVEDYLPAGLMQLIVVNCLLTTGFWTATLLLMAMNRIRLVALLTLAELTFALVLILWLAPLYGLIGLALASLTANAVLGFGWVLPAACRAAGVSVPTFLASTFGRIALSALPSTALILMFPAWLPPDGWLAPVLAVIAIVMVYGPILLLGGLDQWERGSVFASVKRLAGQRGPDLYGAPR